MSERGFVATFSVLVLLVLCSAIVPFCLNGGSADDPAVRFGPSDMVQRDGPPLEITRIECRYAWNSNFSPYACREYTDGRPSDVFVVRITTDCPLDPRHMFSVHNCTAGYSTDFYNTNDTIQLCALTVTRLVNYILFQVYPTWYGRWL